MSVDTSSPHHEFVRRHYVSPFRGSDARFLCISIDGSLASAYLIPTSDERRVRQRMATLCGRQQCSVSFKTLSVSSVTDFYRPLAGNQGADAQLEKSGLPTTKTDPSASDQGFLSTILCNTKETCQCGELSPARDSTARCGISSIIGLTFSWWNLAQFYHRARSGAQRQGRHCAAVCCVSRSSQTAKSLLKQRVWHQDGSLFKDLSLRTHRLGQS